MSRLLPTEKLRSAHSRMETYGIQEECLRKSAEAHCPATVGLTADGLDRAGLDQRKHRQSVSTRSTSERS